MDLNSRSCLYSWFVFLASGFLMKLNDLFNKILDSRKVIVVYSGEPLCHEFEGATMPCVPQKTRALSIGIINRLCLQWKAFRRLFLVVSLPNPLCFLKRWVEMELFAVALSLKGNYYLCGGGGLVTKACPTLVTPWTVPRQSSLPIGFSRQQYWSGLPFPSPGDLPDIGIEPGSPALQADSLLIELQNLMLLWNVSRRRGLILEQYFMIPPPHPWADYQYHPQNQQEPCGHRGSQINVCGYMCVCVVCVCLCVCNPTQLFH